MASYILASLGLFVMQSLLPPTIRYLLAGPGVLSRLRVALGPRDQQPEVSLLCGRAQRALANMQEALPVFLGVALLHVAQHSTSATANRGALLFLVSRTAYVPAYLAGIPVSRSLVWVVSWVGLAMMLASL